MNFQGEYKNKNSIIQSHISKIEGVDNLVQDNSIRKYFSRFFAPIKLRYDSKIEGIELVNKKLTS